MKIVTLYVAYDDTEFDDEEDCRRYESDAYDLMHEAMDTYSFFDKNMNLLMVNSGDIEEFLYSFDMLTDSCEYVKVKQIPSYELHKFIYRNIGCILPENNTGLYRYDWHLNEWVSID